MWGERFYFSFAMLSKVCSTKIFGSFFIGSPVNNNAFTLDFNQTAFVIVEYDYSSPENRTVTAIVDPNNLIAEFNETDNAVTKAG